MIRRARLLVSSLGSWLVAAGPFVLLGLTIVGAVVIGIGWHGNVWLAFAAIVAEITAVLLVAALSTHIGEAITETRQSRRDPWRWRHRRPPRTWRDRRRQVIRLAERGGHRAPGMRRRAA